MAIVAQVSDVAPGPLAFRILTYVFFTQADVKSCTYVYLFEFKEEAHRPDIILQNNL